MSLLSTICPTYCPAQRPVQDSEHPRERADTDLDGVGFADERLSGVTAELLQVGEVPAGFVPELDERVRDLDRRQA